ncbi:hypothetical protein [uncultured Lamprocystis sp.]|jgi:hypothetical protein|uniref:hypothetical protein n=1 Tax=uncultured Lamprocystis sp. TaxID=543132 RepID=UPI0025EA8A12|nr:hypothetical protein [uncultured Lamprocystis sp.]
MAQLCHAPDTGAASARRPLYFFAISAVEGLSNAYLECLNQGLLPITYTDIHDPLFDTMAITDVLIRIPADDPAHGPAALAVALADDHWSEPLARDLQARVAAGFGLTGSPIDCWRYTATRFGKHVSGQPRPPVPGRHTRSGRNSTRSSPTIVGTTGRRAAGAFPDDLFAGSGIE